MRPEDAAEFEGLKPVLSQAKYGSYLILPLKYDKGEVNKDWLEQECRRCRMTTMDLTEPVKELFHSGQSRPRWAPAI